MTDDDILSMQLALSAAVNALEAVAKQLSYANGLLLHELGLLRVQREALEAELLAQRDAIAEADRIALEQRDAEDARRRAIWLDELDKLAKQRDEIKRQHGGPLKRA